MQLPFQLHLAPMKGITCWAFRSICARATDSYTEMVHAKDLLALNRRAALLLDTFPIPNQRQWLQLLTHKPAELAALLQQWEDLRKHYPQMAAIHGLNINAGCPDPSIVREGNGSALLKHPETISRLIQSFLESPNPMGLRIGVKMRLGITRQDINQNKICDILTQLKEVHKDPRVAPPIIHFKLASEKSNDKEHWELLEPIFDLKMPLILNGGIKTPKDLSRIQEHCSSRYRGHFKSQVAGIMIGRGAVANPNCFHAFYKNLPLKNRQKDTLSCNDDWKSALNDLLTVHTPPTKTKENLEKITAIHPASPQFPPN